MNRASGVLLHITSLPSDCGIGSLGSSAIEFMDWLVKGKQRIWQILPLSEPDSVNSPYSSASAFACNVLLSDIGKLVDYGYLTKEQAGYQPLELKNTVSFEAARAIKLPRLEKAFEVFCQSEKSVDYLDFLKRNAYWLDDYALYSVIKSEYNLPWYEWRKELKCRDKAALDEFSEKNRRKIDFVVFLQYVFDRQWRELRSEMHKRGLSIMGDIPMYVNYDSADVWAHPHLFSLNSDLSQKKSAGVPPDYFSENGQLWGNPVYNLKAMAKEKYGWWVERIKRCEALYDILRIDHFRAFDAFWQVDSDMETAKQGEWVKGGGLTLVKLLINSAPSMLFVAEDLGERTDSLDRLMQRSRLPGMKVLEFAFDGNASNAFLPHNFDRNCVAYIGTHDNDTLMGWWKSASEEIRTAVYSYMGMESERELNRKLIKLLSRSVADTVIFTMQDILGLDSESRMNTPGTQGGGNWSFCIQKHDLKTEDAEYLASLSEMYSR